MENISRIVLNKNRGWRGLAEATLYDEDDYDRHVKMVFSFSQAVWNDMQDGYMAFEDDKKYYVVSFGDIEKLPKGQRSVLIKNVDLPVVFIYNYDKTSWTHDAPATHHSVILHYIKNQNNHTQSQWNYIGIRVVPMI